MKKQLIITMFFILNILMTWGQSTGFKDENSRLKDSSFSLYYMEAGLGSGVGSMLPTLNIKGMTFIYTFEQNSYYFEKSKEPDTIAVGVLRKASIDSIIDIVKYLGGDTISKVNPGVMSGWMSIMTIINGTDTINYWFSNALDWTAYRILNILNAYLPEGKKIYVTEEQVTDAESYWINARKDYLKSHKK